MTNPVPAPMCGSCGASLQPPSDTCPVCGTKQWPQPAGAAQVGHHNQPMPAQPAHVHGVVPAKSTGIAILLSLLWLGAGNLYVGQIALGIILLLIDIPLVLLAFTVVGFLVAFPVWLVLVIVSIAMAVYGANRFNQRNGIVVR